MTPEFSWNPTICQGGAMVYDAEEVGSDTCSMGWNIMLQSGPIWPLHGTICGQTIPLYCLEHHSKSPNGSYALSSFESAMPSVSPSARCAVAWIIANGYNLTTNLDEWWAGLGVGTRSAEEAWIVTAIAIWRVLGQVSTTDLITSCGGGIDMELNIACEELINKASAYGATHDCKSVALEEPECSDCACDPGSGLDEMKPTRPKLKMRDPNQAVLSNCDADSESVMACAYNSPTLEWDVMPGDLRVVCGKALIGPIRVIAKTDNYIQDESGPNAPQFKIEGMNACADNTLLTYTDYCGGELPDGPKIDNEFYVMIPISQIHLCFKICVAISVREFPVGLAEIPRGQNVGIATRPCIVHETSCICVCVEIPLAPPEPEPPPLPPIYFPPPPNVGPPTQPPPIYNPPPVLVPPPAPPSVITPPELPPLVITPPPPSPPPPIVNPPEVLIPPPAPPPPPPPPIFNRPVAINPPPPPPPPTYVAPSPVAVAPPPAPPPQYTVFQRPIYFGYRPPLRMIVPPPLPPVRKPKPPVRVVMAPPMPPPPPPPPPPPMGPLGRWGDGRVLPSQTFPPEGC